MSCVTVEVGLRNGRIIPHDGESLPATARALLVVLETEVTLRKEDAGDISQALSLIRARQSAQVLPAFRWRRQPTNAPRARKLGLMNAYLDTAPVIFLAKNVALREPAVRAFLARDEVRPRMSVLTRIE